MRFLTIIFLFSISIVGISQEVHTSGALKNAMKKGDLSAHLSLDSLKTKKNLYALGPLEGLKGEIIILNSEPFIGFEKDQKPVVESSFNHKASMLVWAQVEEWKEIKIPASVRSKKELENFIQKTVQENGISSSTAFPFLVEGEFSSVDWHVVNWDKNDTEHSHHKHKTSGPHGTKTDLNGIILGFYSDHHKGVFTHHTTNIHMHITDNSHSFAAHADAVKPSDVVLKIPSYGH